MNQGTNPNRSIVWSTLLAGAVLFLCGAKPILSPVDRPVAGMAHRSVRIRETPVVVVPHLDDILRDSIVALAREQVGTPYVLGGASPGSGFDCSGFVSWVLSHARTRLPRTARQQAQAGVPIARAKLLPGDLLTFGTGPTTSHVGIYLGDGTFVHASSAAGRVIVSRIDRRVTGLVVPLRGARRVLAVANGG